MLITTEGIIIQLNVSEISILGRVTSGVKLMDLDDSDKKIVIASMTKVRDSIPENLDNPEKSVEESENSMDFGREEKQEEFRSNDSNKDSSLDRLLERAEQEKEE